MLTLQTASGPRRVRRLGLGDIDFAVDLLNEVLSTGEALVLLRTLRRADLSSPEDLLQVLLAGWKVARKPVELWSASLLGMTPEEIADPEKFTLDDLAALVVVLKDHPDRAGFFGRLSKALAEPLLRWLQTLSRERELSTASNNATAGLTST